MPAGVPFHRLARTVALRWWRPPLSLLIIAVGAVVASLVVLMPAMAVVVVIELSQGAGSPGILEDPVSYLLDKPVLYLGIALGSLALLIPIVAFTAWLVERRPIGSVVSVERRLRMRWLLVCAGLALLAQILAMVVVYGVNAVLYPADDSAMFGWAGWGTFLPAAVMTLLLVPFQATAEEFVFRGWLLQAFGAYLRTPWPGIVVSALVFASLHGYGLVGLVDVAVFGFVAGLLAVRTGGLEAPIALHVLHNLGAIMTAAAAGQLDEALVAANAQWYLLAGTAAELVFFAVVVLVLARRRQLRRVSRTEAYSPRSD